MELKFIVLAFAVYLAFYFLHSLIDIFLEWIRYKVDYRVGIDKVNLMEISEGVNDEKISTSAIGFQYSGDDYEEDDSEVED